MVRGSLDEGFTAITMSNATTDLGVSEAKIKQYLVTHTVADFNGSETADTDLFEEGFIDSFGFIELVKYLEKEFQIKFTDNELISNQLNTLNNITSMVQSKLNAG